MAVLSCCAIPERRGAWSVPSCSHQQGQKNRRYRVKVALLAMSTILILKEVAVKRALALFCPITCRMSGGRRKPCLHTSRKGGEVSCRSDEARSRRKGALCAAEAPLSVQDVVPDHRHRIAGFG